MKPSKCRGSRGTGRHTPHAPRDRRCSENSDPAVPRPSCEYSVHVCMHDACHMVHVYRYVQIHCCHQTPVSHSGYGSCAKKIIKFLTCRRKVTAKFGRGYIEQAFNRLAVRSGLLHGPENAPYQLRSDHNLVGTGRRGDGRGRAEGPHMLVRVKVEFETENA